MESQTIDNGKRGGDKTLTKKALGDPATRGRTDVADNVVTEIARIAAEEIEGIYKLGDTGFSGVLGRLTGNKAVDGSVGNKEAALSLDVVVRYGYSLKEVTDNLRRHVIERVEHLAGRNVIAVDINVVDIHVDAPTKPARQRALE